MRLNRLLRTFAFTALLGGCCFGSSCKDDDTKGETEKTIGEVSGVVTDDRGQCARRGRGVDRRYRRFDGDECDGYDYYRGRRPLYPDRRARGFAHDHLQEGDLPDYERDAQTAEVQRRGDGYGQRRDALRRGEDHGYGSRRPATTALRWPGSR